MEWYELESIAEQLYQRAGLDILDPAPAPLLVTALLGPDSIRIVSPCALPCWAALDWIGGSPRVLVRSDTPIREISHTICHELMHWAAYEYGISITEDECDYGGAALMAPYHAFRREHFDPRAGFYDVSRRYVATESFSGMRFGEVRFIPTLLKTRQKIRVRGDSSWVWPPLEVLNEMLQRGGVEGVISVRLSDDPSRIILFADQ